ncbi:MAG TPA: HD domain-containing protein [Roseiflexaceae bacterium]|nr:HD domain-containing protein [Roseiflexaceae bacterium]
MSEASQAALFAALVERVRPALDALTRAGGAPLIVGGAVRDALLGQQSKDIDIEVYGLSADAVVAALGPLGPVNAVGRSFGVIKLRLRREELDVALPSRDNRHGPRGRLPELDPSMTPQEAFARRDFTWNALGLTPQGELIDYYGGLADLRAGLIRHTSGAFGEDPLRVLRAMQFAARFSMRLAPETAALCHTLLPQAAGLPVERVWSEWQKWAVQGRDPAAGLLALEQSGWLALYPQLAALRGCPQEPRYHPEGDVWTHTLHVCGAAARIAEREQLQGEERALLLLAGLCHDLGKPATTQQAADGRIRSRGHAEAGVPLASAFLLQIGALRRLIEPLLPLVREHGAHYGMQTVTARAVRRLAARLRPATFAQLALLVEADYGGRPPLPPRQPMEPILARARELELLNGPPTPILRGRHLREAGYPADQRMAPLLRRAYEAQLDGLFATPEEGLTWLDQALRSDGPSER